MHNKQQKKIAPRGSEASAALAKPQALVLLGATGNAFDALDIIEAINADQKLWDVTGFLDDFATTRNDALDLDHLGRLRDAADLAACMFVSTIRSENSFRDIHTILDATGLPIERYATLVHPKSGVSSRAVLGRGVLVNYGVSIAGDVCLGDHALIGPGCIVGHQTTIDRYSCLAAGSKISGNVQIGRNCYIGCGAMVRQGVKIGDGALVGMGAVVLNDVAPGQTVVGNPARDLAR